MEFFPNKLAYCGITVCRDCGHLKQNFSFSNNEHCLGTRKTQFFTTMRVHRNNNIFFFLLFNSVPYLCNFLRCGDWSGHGLKVSAHSLHSSYYASPIR